MLLVYFIMQVTNGFNNSVNGESFLLDFLPKGVSYTMAIFRNMI